MNQPIRIASRFSPLALAQVEEIVQELKIQGRALDFQLITMETSGDKDKHTPLTESRDDFFTDAIDQALLGNKADLAVHSAKDLPQNMPEGLKIFALTKGMDGRDAWVSRMAWQDLKPGAKIGTSSVLRQHQVLHMRPDADIVHIRGTIQERLLLLDEGKLDGLVMAACALKRLKLEHRIKDFLPWEAMPLQGQLAVVGRRKDLHLEVLFQDIDVRRHYGKVSLVGAGPGDSRLITLKGVDALKTADCVFYDYLVDPELLKFAPQAETIYAGKRKGEQALPQEELSRMLKMKAMAGKNVVRLKGGDPLIFGRGADEIQYLRSYHIEVEIIPGVSSATGIPSALGIPLTARGISSSVAFISGHEEQEDQKHPKDIHLPQADTLVFLMGLTKLNTIVQSLRKAGWSKDTPMMIIANGTKAKEQIVKGTLESIEAKALGLKPPALILAGRTIDFYKPAMKPTLLHCGTHPQAYQPWGNIVSWPMIEITPAAMNQAQTKALQESFKQAEIIVCTSWSAGEYFIKAIRALDPNTDFKTKKFAVIGRRTQMALEKSGIEADLVSPEETAQGLFKAMSLRWTLKGKSILWPRSNLPNPFLKEALQAQGAEVTEITIYENTKPAKRALPEIKIDGVIFTSPSTVRNFLTDYGIIPNSWKILAKGPVTLQTLQASGYQDAVSLS